MEYLDHPVPRSLIGDVYASLGNGSIVIPQDECFCMKWLESMGSEVAKKVANALQWSAFSLSVIILVYYAWATWKTTCGWEEIYVCCVELTKVVIEFFHEFDEPSMLYLANGNRVLWLRYAEWLLTCPVILIHLSNLTGLKDDYSKRTMRLLVSDIGTIVWGTTSAMSKGYVKVIFFLLGVAYGANTFFHAAKVYIESFHTVPKGICRNIVRVMAWLFFLSWGMFPIMFILGPEGLGHLNLYGSTIGHTIIDVLSKNCWGLLGHILRLKIHEHILLHGDIRKVTKVRVAGEDMEVETLVDAEDADGVKKSTAHYASRESFLVMRDRLKDKGYDVRASLDNSGGTETSTAAAAVAPAIEGAKAGLQLSTNVGGGKGLIGGDAETAGASPISPGRVILSVPDISMVDFFREQFIHLPVPYEVVPALGADNTVQLVQQASGLGGCDFVLIHPDFLRDKTPNSLVARLRAMGQRVAAFGWAQMGPVRDLIEDSGLDGWLEGPSFGSGISLASLTALIVRMQQMRKLSSMGMMPTAPTPGRANASVVLSSGGSMFGGMTGSGMMASVSNSGAFGGMNGMNAASANSALMVGGLTSPQGSAGPQMSGLSGVGGASMMMNGGGMMGGPAATPSVRFGTNPLFNTAPSPLSSQPGDSALIGGAAGAAAMGMAGVGPAVAPAGGMPSMVGAGGGMSEAEMLQQLMNEINRLKSELGDQQ